METAAMMPSCPEPEVKIFSPEELTAAREAGASGFAKLIPPSGATYGMLEVTCPFKKETLFKGGDIGESDKQQVTGQLINQFHVYWVNGKAPCYYLVILKQQASVNPAMMGMMRNHKGARGHVLHTAQVIGSVRDKHLNVFQKGVTILKRGPMGNMSDLMTYNVDVPMYIIVKQFGGPVPTDWTATDAATIQRKGWSLKEETNFKNHQTRWKYHVREPWNPETNPPGVKEELWRPVISPNDYDIIEFPESMYSVLDAIGFTAWRFDGSLVDQSSPGKRDLYLELDGDFYCDSALFINPANQYYKKWQCAEDGFGNSYSGKIVNLGEIAQVLP